MGNLRLLKVIRRNNKTNEEEVIIATLFTKTPEEYIIHMNAIASGHTYKLK